MSTILSGTASIDNLGVLHASGEDARKFLHSQLSNDFMLLDHTHARLAAFLSAKGRMQASFIGLRHGENDVLLLVDKSLLAAVQKRLSMFVLRAKVKITDVSNQWVIQGIIGQDTITAAQAQDLPNTPWSLLHKGVADASEYFIRLYPAQEQSRALHLFPVAQIATAPNLPAQDWRISEILSGVATLSAPVVEQFVPQMLNYESIGGINFKKGCYPGQEVVARSQFRGAIKRRAYIAQSNAAAVQANVAAGDEIYLRSETSEDAQPCGLVVQAAYGSDGIAWAIISIQTAAAEQLLEVRPNSTTTPSKTATPITLLPRPYPLLEDI